MPESISPEVAKHEDHAVRICWCGAGPKAEDWQNHAMTVAHPRDVVANGRTVIARFEREIVDGYETFSADAVSELLGAANAMSKSYARRILMLEGIICTLRQSDQEGLWHGQLSDEEEAVMKEVYGA